MGTLALVHLPPGYRVEWVEDNFRLFDPRGERVATYPSGLASVLTIEEDAWRHVWGQVDGDIRREIKQFSRGTRAVTELNRMRQYVRFLEILGQAAPGAVVADLPRRPIPLIVRRPLRAAKVAAAVGLAAAGLLLFLLVPSEPPATPTADAPQGVPESAAPSQPASNGQARQKPAPLAAVKPGRSAEIGRQLKPIAGYAMTFGRFTSLKTAQACARQIRSKGYMANVVQVGNSFRVLGRTYSTRFDAERMAKNLQEINLPASVQPVGL